MGPILTIKKKPHHVEPIQGLFFRVLGIVYIASLTIRSYFRSLFERGTVVLLILYIIAIAAEIGMERYGLEAGTHELPWIRYPFYVAIGFALYTKVREWNEHRQELFFIEASTQVLKIDAQKGADDKQTISELLDVFRTNFELKGALNANFAELENGALRVTSAAPDTAAYDETLRLPIGDGGSGYCFENNVPVYIPSKWLRHGITMDGDKIRPFQMILDLYVPCQTEPFNSILSVPVSTGGKVYGVLNFDSVKRNAFRRIDFQQAAFFGFVLAKFLQSSERKTEQNG